jgi:hypothetical protein
MAPKAIADMAFIICAKVQSPSSTSTEPYANATAHITVEGIANMNKRKTNHPWISH